MTHPSTFRAVRRAAAAYGWPPLAGAPLAAGAVVEAVARLRPGVDLPLPLLIGLCATVPLLFLRAHPTPVAVTVSAATVLTVALYGTPAFTALAALLLAWGTVAHRALLRARDEAAARDASRVHVERSLLELTARGERARIARDLHDVVAHHISMISVQAETARLTTPGMPEEGARRLLAIGETARTALTEMRRLLGVLREDAGEDATPRVPQPGMRELLALVDESRTATGGRTRLIMRGRVEPLDAGVELAAYRVVQEALTNVRKHAPGAAVDVEVEYAGEELRVRVRDNGPGPRPAGAVVTALPTGTPPSGHGLLGMRERVASVGGTLWTGPAAPFGFTVEASLPGTVER